jgi:hypothetical protein
LNPASLFFLFAMRPYSALSNYFFFKMNKWSKTSGDFFQIFFVVKKYSSHLFFTRSNPFFSPLHFFYLLGLRTQHEMGNI